MTGRWGMTVPIDGVSLRDQGGWFAELETAGYTDLWSSEAAGADAFTPLVVAAGRTTGVHLGTAVVPVFTRGPATIALSSAALAELAPGRVTIGIGASSPVVVSAWNAQVYERPVARVRDTLRFLRSAFEGQKVTHDYETFAIRGFRLGRTPEQPPSLMVAALRPTMLRLARDEADGAIVVFLGANDVQRVRAELGAKDLVARIIVCPVDDAATVYRHAKPHLAAYLSVPAYEAYHRWLGRGDALAPVWSAWTRGDRRAAAEALPDEVVDDLVVWGTPDECRRKIAAYVDAGVTCPVLAIERWGVEPMSAARLLAP